MAEKPLHNQVFVFLFFGLFVGFFALPVDDHKALR